MSRYPGVPWSPSPNFFDGPTPKTRIVLHRMAGSFAGGYAWLRDPASQVSANFVVDNVSGATAQLVDTADVAWAQADFNSGSISIEIGGEPTDPLSADAQRAVAALVAMAHARDGIPLEPAVAPHFAGLAYHGQLGVAGGNHPDCPGSVVLSVLPEILAEARILADQEVPMSVPDVDDRRAQIREWYHELLGTGPGGRDPESDAMLASWTDYWAAHGREATFAAIYDSDEAKTRRAREAAVFDAAYRSAAAESSSSAG